MSNKKHTKNKNKFEECVNRLLEASEFDTLGELGKALGYKSGNALTNWKERGPDYNKVLELYPTISVIYIRDGIGPPFIDVESLDKGLDQLSGRINEEGIPYRAQGLLLEALEEEASKIQSDLQGLVDRIYKIRRLYSDN